MEGQRGFSLIELLVAAAIAFVVGWQLLALIHTTVLGSKRLDAALRAHSAADRLEERLADDADTAWSVFVPRTALDGSDNRDGHEVDFVTEDGSHRSYWWAYVYDARASRVTNYAYTPGGTRMTGETYDGIDVFAAVVHPITDLAQPSSPAFDPLFASVSVAPVDVPFGLGPDAIGGNHLVRVQCAGGGVRRDALLSAGTAPSRFTVVVEYTPAAPTPTP